MINGISKENNKNKDLENNYMTSFCHTQFLADDFYSSRLHRFWWYIGITMFKEWITQMYNK